MNDDLGNFPTPPSLTPKNTDPVVPATPYTPPAFEPTPDEIPTFSTPKITVEEAAPIVNIPTQTPVTPISEPTLATTPPTTKSSSPLVFIVLLLAAGIGISGSVFLYSQSSALKKQLTDITQTLEQQKAIITPSPTPTIIDIPTPTPSLIASEEATITPTPTATPSTGLIPLALAPQALKVGINHEPNAQLILIKAENTTNKDGSLIKYFFRKDLTTKKYFYVSINSKNESEINDNAIYVSPDNNIPSLNDLVLGNKLGLDYKEAYSIATKLCTTLCTNLSANAQFIMSGANTIWQITIDPAGKKYIVQINSITKEVLYKSPNI